MADPPKDEQQKKPNVSKPAVVRRGSESNAQRVAPTSSRKAFYKGGETEESLRSKRKAYAEKMRKGPTEYLMREVVIDKNGVPRP